jgi:hypothetical protein
MPAFRIVYVRDEAVGPETVTTGFPSLEQALDVFAARGLRILYIAEQGAEDPRSRRPTEGGLSISRLVQRPAAAV